MQLFSNRVLMGKYEVGKLLGQGAFAKVYHAKNRSTGESVAIKVLDKEKILKVGMPDQIKREIFIMRLVRHPNIVQLYEVMATKTKIYFVMEYVKGGELFNKLVSKGKLKEDVARKYFQQLISAVDFCHSRGVYHRDLKPENLLLDENGNLKVSDFGLSALREQLRQDGMLHTQCGTPAYVAPEVITKKGYDGSKADIWSCGVILFVLLAGYLPFHDSNLMSMYKKICKGEFKCPSWFSSGARKLLHKLLDPNPKTRITIPRLMETSWFKKDFKPIKVGYSEEDDVDDVIEGICENDTSENMMAKEGMHPNPKPAYMNAFDIISFSRGFDLSGLFDKNKYVREKHFTSVKPISEIVSKLEEVSKLENLSFKKKDYKVKMKQQEADGNGGMKSEPLSLVAEIFEVTPSLFVVELKKITGDLIQYEKFCEEKLRPALGDIVLSWQTSDPE
eukprot:TRINITY_DN489_c0_g1_i1.p1 TRINITY_DN489_c0_g1~~TRINITY_DN489_c0_g1_i1.p1  ORF type:complete len:448 (-),score=80.23 TRINITY_DN489_c0_g1_i1:261-1604(-)